MNWHGRNQGSHVRSSPYCAILKSQNLFSSLFFCPIYIYRNSSDDSRVYLEVWYTTVKFKHWTVATQLVVLLRYTSINVFRIIHIAFSGVAIRQIELNLRRIHDLSYIHLIRRFTYIFEKNDRRTLPLSKKWTINERGFSFDEFWKSYKSYRVQIYSSCSVCVRGDSLVIGIH